MPPSPPTPNWPAFPVDVVPFAPTPSPPLPPAPPAPPSAALDAIVLPETLRDPAALKIAPPSPPVPPAPPVPVPPRPVVEFAPLAPLVPESPIARLLMIRTEESVTLAPELRIPPPSPTTRPCWIVTLEIDTLPPRISKTRSRLLPSMMVLLALRPLIVRLPEISRSPVAPAVSPAPGIVRVNVPAGRMIWFEPPLASAAMMAERSETWPVASLPLRKFTATVSSVVLTRKVERTTRSSSRSGRGDSRAVDRPRWARRWLKMDIEDPLDVMLRCARAATSHATGTGRAGGFGNRY